MTPVVAVAEASTACPLCHTAGPIAGDSRLEGGDGWRCVVCHQAWDVNRLATVVAYAAFCAERAETR